jgi:hypothetical protein
MYLRWKEKTRCWNLCSGQIIMIRMTLSIEYVSIDGLYLEKFHLY